jgi:hypothetical protein
MTSEHDFGFTAVTDEELRSSETQIKQSLEQLEVDHKKQLAAIKAALYPFINNLMKDPQKTTLIWPTRVEKMTEFKAKLDSLFAGKL